MRMEQRSARALGKPISSPLDIWARRQGIRVLDDHSDQRRPPVGGGQIPRPLLAVLVKMELTPRTATSCRPAVWDGMLEVQDMSIARHFVLVAIDAKRRAGLPAAADVPRRSWGGKLDLNHRGSFASIALASCCLSPAPLDRPPSGPCPCVSGPNLPGAKQTGQRDPLERRV